MGDSGQRDDDPGIHITHDTREGMLPFTRQLLCNTAVKRSDISAGRLSNQVDIRDEVSLLL